MPCEFFFCAKLFVVFVEYITKIRFEIRGKVAKIFDLQATRPRMRLTSKNAALVKTNNNSIFESEASFDLHSHHAGNKYLDSHNNRQAGPGVVIVPAKWNTKQS